MAEMTESQIRHLKGLAERAHEKELTFELTRLYGKFEKWREDKLSLWELNEILRQFHNDTASEIYKTYVLVNDPRNAVAKAIVNNILTLAEVDEDCRPLLESIIAFYRD